jgi:hypothetical protein
MRRIARSVLALGLLAATVPLPGCRSVDGKAPWDAVFGSPHSAAQPGDGDAALAEAGTVGEPKYKLDPGVTGYSHILGWISQRFVYPGPLVERAIVETLVDMGGHSVKRGIKCETIVTFNGLLFDGRWICIEMEPQGENTVVKMRIDVYGDEPKSKVFLDRIAVRLSTLPQSISPPFDPRALSDSVTHRGMSIEGYRGAPLR